MSKIPGILLIIVVLGLVVYIFNSGVIGQLGSLASGPFAGSASSTSSGSSSPSFFSFLGLHGLFGNVSSTTGDNSNLTTPGGSGSIIYATPTSTESAGGQSSSISAAGAPTSSVPSYEIPPGYTANQFSPYFHMLRLGSVSQQQISLSSYGTYGQATTTVDVTGWEVKTNRGGDFIPQAVNLYSPTGPAVLGNIILTLSQSQVIYLYSNSSPVNLRLNECLGYLNSTQQFNPQFPYSCPYAVNHSVISSFTGACQNYIASLGNCQTPNFGSSNFPNNDYQCQNYLENNFTYNSCVIQHAADPGFFENEWHVWIGSSPLDPYHDNVELLDRNGLLVDFYQY